MLCVGRFYLGDIRKSKKISMKTFAIAANRSINMTEMKYNATKESVALENICAIKNIEVRRRIRIKQSRKQKFKPLLIYYFDLNRKELHNPLTPLSSFIDSDGNYTAER